MPEKSHLQTKTTSPPTTISWSPSGIVQRVCECGGVMGLTGDCETCASDRLSGFRKTQPVFPHQPTNRQPIAAAQGKAPGGYSFGDLAIAPKARLGIQTEGAIGSRSQPSTYPLVPDLTQLTNPAIQRQVAPEQKPDAKAREIQDLALPWQFGDYSLFEIQSNGVRFLVGVTRDIEKTVRAAIPKIGKQIAMDNSRIPNAALRVMTCLIVSTTTRFALWKGKPVLMINPDDAAKETVAHEMGHAILHALEQQAGSGTKDTSRAGHFRMRLADIYARLGETKKVTEGGKTKPAGYWMVDPSQWSRDGKSEHPWEDPDEFFASAKEGYQMNRKGLEASISRFKKEDPAVGGPAKELLSLLDAFFQQRRLPATGVPEKRASRAKEAWEKATGISNIEETILPNTPLEWLVNPQKRPGQE